MEEMEEEEPEKFANHFSKAVAEEVSGGDLEEIYKKVPGDGGGAGGGASQHVSIMPAWRPCSKWPQQS